jgi:pimeloyl-ACP methyl ester carboxylesterase
MKTYLIALALLLFAVSCSFEPGEEQSQTKSRAKLPDSALSMNYIENGKPVIFLIHGWCIDKSYWDIQVADLKDHYSVLAIDLPGFGESKEGAYSIEGYGREIRNLLEKMDLDSVILVGHSMGGDIMLEAAVNNPRVMGLIGVDNFKDVGVPMDSETEEAVADFMEMLRNNFSEIAPAYAEGSLFHPSTDSLVRKRVMQDFAQADSVAAIASLESLLNYGAKEFEALSKIEQPLILINSNASPTLRAGLDSSGVNYQVLEIDSTGHYPMIEKQDKFNQLLREAILKLSESRDTLR